LPILQKAQGKYYGIVDFPLGYIKRTYDIAVKQTKSNTAAINGPTGTAKSETVGQCSMKLWLLNSLLKADFKARISFRSQTV
jgi:hypothetical protein